MSQTSNHGYNVPNEGEQDWHEPLNENFRQYDTDIEVRDVEDNRDEYDPLVGAKFFATDTGTVWIGNGATWSKVRSSGDLPEFSTVAVDPGSTVPAQLTLGSPDEGYIFSNNLDDVLTVQNADDDKLLSVMPTDPHVGIGTPTSEVPLDVRGRNNWNLDESDGDVRIGDGDHRLAIGVALDGGGAGAANLRAKGGIERLNLGAGTDGHTVQIDPDAVSIDGDLDVTGNKNFTQTIDTDDGEKEVVYTACEAPTARTEVSGVARLEDGRAEVDLPEHFTWVTSDEEPLIVQVTPHASEPVRPQVTERSTDRLVVEEVGDGPGTYEISYTVKGTRDGHVGKEAVREPGGGVTTGTPVPAEADD